MNSEKYKENHQENKPTNLFAKIQVSWPESKEEIWARMKPELQAPVIKMKTSLTYWKLSIAAGIVILLSSGIFLSNYKVNYKAMAAQHVNTLLPDGSAVALNAGSEISYKPYWWWKNRRLTLKGEAFFDVKKGKTFDVLSEKGITEVLGTSFIIFARKNRYEVTCIRGKVKVQSTITKDAVIIHPQEKASLQETGQLKVVKDINTDNAKAWMENKMIFTSVPLSEVFDEMERQYNVQIEIPRRLTEKYTGSFEKPKSVEIALNLICRPFRLSIKKESKNKFLIKNK